MHHLFIETIILTLSASILLQLVLRNILSDTITGAVVIIVRYTYYSRTMDYACNAHRSGHFAK